MKTTRDITHYVEWYRDRRGKNRWRLRARNGTVVADCGGGNLHATEALRTFANIQSAFLNGTIRHVGIKR